MDANDQAKPWVPAIENLTHIGPVGVLLFLQHRRPHQAMGKADAHGGVVCRHERILDAKSCGYAALLGQRNRVDHIPTVKKQQAFVA